MASGEAQPWEAAQTRPESVAAALLETAEALPGVSRGYGAGVCRERRHPQGENPRSEREGRRRIQVLVWKDRRQESRKHAEHPVLARTH